METHYDCSSFVITAYQNSGVPVKDNGMTYTREIKITHSRSTARNTSERGICSRRKSDNENRNRSAGEIEADDVKARQSMSKAERLNTFPKSMKPNQNADVVFWENGKGTNKTKFSLKGNSDNENSNIGEKDVEAIQSIARKSIYDFSDEDMKKQKK